MVIVKYYIIVTFSTLIIAVAGEKLQSTSYSFDEYYTFDLNSRSCLSDDRPWTLVDYMSLEMKPIKESATALMSSPNSCISTLPRTFAKDGVLSFLVYATSSNCVIEIALINNEDDDIVTYLLENAGGFNRHWTQLSIVLKYDLNGYIRLRGSCHHDNDVILIDSYNYYAKQSKHNKIKEANEILGEDADEFLLYDPAGFVGDVLREDGSGDGETTGETEDATSLWNAFTITFVVVGASVGIALVAYSAYYFGKYRAANNVGRLFDEVEIFPESTITLPRVRSAYR